MNYRERLNHWAVVRLLPNFRHQVIVRCHRRSDAEGYCGLLRQIHPQESFIVLFDPPAKPPVDPPSNFSSESLQIVANFDTLVPRG